MQKEHFIWNTAQGDTVLKALVMSTKTTNTVLVLFLCFLLSLLKAEDYIHGSSTRSEAALHFW